MKRVRDCHADLIIGYLLTIALILMASALTSNGNSTRDLFGVLAQTDVVVSGN